MYSNSWCSCSFEPEILKIGQSTHKMYSNNIVNFQESTTILNACTKMSGNLSYAPRTFVGWLDGFYGIPALVGNLMPNRVYTYILNDL